MDLRMLSPGIPINSDLTPESVWVLGWLGTVLKICESAHTIAFYTKQQAFKKQFKSEKVLEVWCWSMRSIVFLLPHKQF